MIIMVMIIVIVVIIIIIIVIIVIIVTVIYEDRRGTNGVITNGVVANLRFFDRGAFWVLP